MTEKRSNLPGSHDVDVQAPTATCARAREKPADVPCDRPGWKRVQEIVIRPVVTETQDEVRRLLPIREEASYVETLVDPERPHLDDLVPGEDLGGCSCKMLVQVVEQLPRSP